MEARYSFSPTTSREDPAQQSPMQQEPGASHSPPSRSSQTYTQPPTDTGHGTSGQSVTTLAEEQVQPRHNEAASVHEHRQALTPDQHDFSHAGTWAAAEPHIARESDRILAPIHRAAASRENAEDANPDAVRIFRASLDRKGPQEPPTST